MDKIVFLGKNYAEHAAEMGEVQPEKPVIFIKPPSVLRVGHNDGENLELRIPKGRGAVHPEVELVLRLDRGGFNLDLKDAEKAIGSVSLGLDMTLRDEQKQAKLKGHPWTTSKVFPDSAVVGPWVRVSEFPDYTEQNFTLAIDDEIRQESSGQKMLFTPAECVAYVSQFFLLKVGDLIFTGTPAGVGPVVSGSRGVLSFGAIRYQVVWKEDSQP